MPENGRQGKPVGIRVFLGRYTMRIVAKSGILLLLACGCASQKQLEQQWERESNTYYAKYCQAQSPQAAIDALNDYLRFVDDFERKKVVGPRYAFARALTEGRISMIYEQLGDHQASRTFMDRAVDDVERDKYVEKTQDKQAVETGLRQTIEKIDGWNTIEWRKTRPNMETDQTNR
jgi:hypothetical protein